MTNSVDEPARGLGARLGRFWKRITAGDSAPVEAPAQPPKGQPIDQCRDRAIVSMVGEITSVTTGPPDQPQVLAKLQDDTGVVKVIWMGRRTISGVEPGRMIRIEGRVSRCHDDEIVIFNPRYELLTP